MARAMTDGLPTCHASPERSYGRCQLASYLGEERAGVRWTPPYYVTLPKQNLIVTTITRLLSKVGRFLSESVESLM